MNGITKKEIFVLILIFLFSVALAVYYTTYTNFFKLRDTFSWSLFYVVVSLIIFLAIIFVFWIYQKIAMTMAKEPGVYFISQSIEEQKTEHQTDRNINNRQKTRSQYISYVDDCVRNKNLHLRIFGILIILLFVNIIYLQSTAITLILVVLLLLFFYAYNDDRKNEANLKSQHLNFENIHAIHELSIEHLDNEIIQSRLDKHHDAIIEKEGNRKLESDQDTEILRDKKLDSNFLIKFMNSISDILKLFKNNKNTEY